MLNLLVKSFTFAAVLLLLFTSCNRKTAVEGDNEIDEAANFEAFLLRYNERIIEPDWFFGKGNMKLNYEQFNTSLNAVVSMKHDERVLMAISKLGFEIGRAYASMDTVILIDRMRKQYFIATGEELEKKDIPFNLQRLQSLILGRPEFTVVNDYHFGEDSISFNSFMPPFQFFYTFDESRLMKHTSISHTADGQEITASLDNYVQLENNKLFAQTRGYEWLKNGEKQGEVELEFGKIELDVPRSISISIPPGYTEMAF